MLKEIPGHETNIHLCEQMKCGGTIMKLSPPREIGKKDGFRVQIHDIHPYLFIEATKTMLPITYCPFCGADIDREERP
jgi:hypothetical protein